MFIAIIMLVSLGVLLLTRGTFYSAFILSSLIYASPVLFTSHGYPDEIALSWGIILSCGLLAHLLMLKYTPDRKRASFNLTQVKLSQPPTENAIFNVTAISMFALIVALSSGFGVFFDGKYGRLPGGNLFLYYSWVSLMTLSITSNFLFRDPYSFFSLFGFFQIFMLFVSGDRTIIAILAVILFIILTENRTPIMLALKRPLLTIAALFLGLPFLLISKTIYTLLPQYGFSSTMLNELLSLESGVLFSRNFEPVHTNSIFSYVVSYNYKYEFWDLVAGLPAFMPGSSFFGIDAHRFSDGLKEKFFTGWSEAAGVGANFWAQGYAIDGLFGVFIFTVLALGALFVLQTRFSARRGHSKVTYLVCAGIVGFYLHRNSMEQILSFTGRTLFFGWVVGFSARIFAQLFNSSGNAKMTTGSNKTNL